MECNEIWTKIRHKNLKMDGVSDPLKVDNFVGAIYTSMKEQNFSIIESDMIAKYLSDLIENDKRLILREPLKSVEKYNKEG